jgi:hypothetical protein
MASQFPLLRPYLWIALAAFLCGFTGYLALGLGRAGDQPVHKVSVPAISVDDAGPPRAV